MTEALVWIGLLAIFIWGLLDLYNIKNKSSRRRPFDIRDLRRK